ncbi:transglycosylase domain-containing protein [Paenibacillus contaminans]|uniref:Penicillin-binding protein n=1 Tax=Paenibacillus contaminans TaxID=450362 RepID=A0A329MKB3_9BACL|nr:PBP1A family penicillin-binding protein [Paenibacillus contaminans]RAV19756.1 penicillin-binding protein [Paenibacillus contaminans]
MKKPKAIWMKMTIFFIAAVAAAIAAAAIWIGRMDVSGLNDPLPEPTTIYDRNGAPVTQLSSSKIDPVPLQDIPVQLLHAVIAVEDRRYYEHSGVDVKSIARALFTNAKSGEVMQGGSTITQQLAKNMFLTAEQTMGRKLKEAAMALKIESTLSKDQILELYINQIYFGEGRWGVQEAARLYFGKDVRDLSLPESALLAGLPKAPTRYSPIQNKEKALERRNLVLGLMKQEGYINEEEYDKAVNSPLALAKTGKDQTRGKHASYVDYVIEEAVKLYGFTEEQLLTGGLQLYTELDPKVQNAVEDVYASEDSFPKSTDDQLIQSGAVVLDPSTGGVRGMVGNRGDHVFRGFNRASQLKRQPGSTFKPLVVYAPALEKGYTPYSRLYDGPLDINGYRPQDWDRSTRGEVSLYEAVLSSWNIPAVWLLNEIGIDYGMDFASKLDIPLGKEDRTLGIALGGLQTGVSPLQMAQAYGMFPNQGKMNKAHAITRITTKDGQPLIEASVKPVQVMTPANANTMTAMLQDVVGKGTGTNAALSRPSAGKTGTTQLPDSPQFEGANGVKDAWFVGYTPELVTAVWLGYDQTDKDHYLTTSGGAYPAGIFRAIMTKALEGAPVTAFQRPPALGLSTGSGSDGPKENGNGHGNPKEKDKEKDKGKGKNKKDKDED